MIIVIVLCSHFTCHDFSIDFQSSNMIKCGYMPKYEVKNATFETFQLSFLWKGKKPSNVQTTRQAVKHALYINHTVKQ